MNMGLIYMCLNCFYLYNTGNMASKCKHWSLYALYTFTIFVVFLKLAQRLDSEEFNDFMLQDIGRSVSSIINLLVHMKFIVSN